MNDMMEMKKMQIKSKLMGLMNMMSNMGSSIKGSMGSGMNTLMSGGLMMGGGCCMPMGGGD